jgi:hypothetical protein
MIFPKKHPKQKDYTTLESWAWATYAWLCKYEPYNKRAYDKLNAIMRLKTMTDRQCTCTDAICFHRHNENFIKKQKELEEFFKPEEVSFKPVAEDGKLKPSLASIPARVLEGIANVLGFGGSKYYFGKWLKEPTSSFKRVDSALRHINKWLQGIDNDEESNLHHLDHAITQLIMAREYIYRGFEDGR